MSRLDQSVRIGAVYTRSINITRDVDALDLVQAYLPTSRALQSLRQIADGFDDGAHSRALALIGPYGSGKSAFGLFVSALMAAPDGALHQAASAVLETADPKLNARFRERVQAQRGFLRVTVNGIPDSLIRQFLFALAESAEQAALDPALVNDILDAAEPGTPMDAVLKLVSRVQHAWSHAGGSGVLIELDELGKFLEYASYHPRQREIHLLQLLAEHAHQASAAPLHLLVMLHQAFEHYSNRLGKHLRDEWQKVQGRFEAIAFLEPAEQSLRIVAAAFARDDELPAKLAAQLDDATTRLTAAGALPHGLDEAKARRLFDRCYPLHPVTLLILPTLCQKVAQNERTLFSYLGSSEPFGLRERLSQMRMGDWVTPWDLYDYFLLNQAGSVSDPLTYHRWVEVITALERLDGGPDDAAVHALKTIGLLNLIGAQRGLKASQALLHLVFGDKREALIQRLETASAVHYRHFSQEYRVWQGSDFDLHGALQQASAEQAQQPLADILNQLAPLKPVVARRATIETGTLRCFTPCFTARDRWPPKPLADGELGLWFYLAEDDDNLQLAGPRDDARDDGDNATLADAPVGSVVAVCQFTERLREAIAEWMALQDLPKRHAALHHDPVAQREHRAWLNNAERETTQLIRTLLEAPEALHWFFGGRQRPVRDRRHLQQQLSRWIDYQCYPNAPRLRNELINRDRPSPSANLGRKRLLAAMLSAADQPDLGMTKTPAEKSLYLSLLRQSKLHREENGRLGFFPPRADDDPCRLTPLWNTVTRLLGNAGESQVPLPRVYDKLRQPPLGAKLGVLPVLIVAYLLANRRDVALYQEGAFCEDVTIEQVELLCRRPELFALERFDLAGLRGDLFDRYISSVVGQVPPDATLLDIVRPLVRFVSALPDYSQQSKSLSANAQRVRDAFQQASSPGTLLFDTLPLACDIAPTAFADGDPAVVEQFIERLVSVLRELKQAYPLLLEHWQQALGGALLGAPVADLHRLRDTVAERFSGLDRYTPDRMGLGALIRRLGDTNHKSDQAWLESVGTLIAKIPPTKWRDETLRQAELRLRELAEQLLDLEKLRLAQPDGGGINGALLLKTVDAKRGEISHIVHLSSAQRAAAATEAERIADSLTNRDAAEQLAIVAALLERLTNSASPEGEARD